MKIVKTILPKLVCFVYAITVVILPFLEIPKAYADTLTGKVLYTLNVRNAPGSSTAIGKLSEGAIITILDTVPPTDSAISCSTGLWYKITYSGNPGYVCTAYVTTSYTDDYDRPWTSPKKAIVGGAKYIARNYISKGQYTSYLKKFNVNPNSYYSVYTHQYMTNVRAASSEAYSSYTTYLANGLLNQPLVFTIPIFNNMPTTYTALPGGSADTTGQSQVTDTAFEAALDAQGFPETYKAKLRALHASYPNWVFESLNTGLDWNEAVNAEQPVSYVDGSNTALRDTDANGNYILKEGSTWYLANDATTAYYLDPRNFLYAERILMFEKLAYSSLYTSSIVQTLLNSTFMAGLSIPDNEPYASIFVEAGQAADVSPIYLTSLAIQESGVGGSMATTGQQFTYYDVTYTGLYNFFNIGASSSEQSPIRAGLVWANGGSTSTVVNIDNPVTPTAEGTYLNKLGFVKSSDYVTGVDLNTTIGFIKNQLTNTTVTVTDANGNTLSDNAVVGTGTKVVIADGTNTYTNTAVIYGDISGDGAINAIDLLYMRKYLLGTYNLTGANLMAARVAKGSSVGAADLLYLRKYLLDSNTYKITQ